MGGIYRNNFKNANPINQNQYPLNKSAKSYMTKMLDRWFDKLLFNHICTKDTGDFMKSNKEWIWVMIINRDAGSELR